MEKMAGCMDRTIRDELDLSNFGDNKVLGKVFPGIKVCRQQPKAGEKSTIAPNFPCEMMLP